MREAESDLKFSKAQITAVPHVTAKHALVMLLLRAANISSAYLWLKTISDIPTARLAIFVSGRC